MRGPRSIRRNYRTLCHPEDWGDDIDDWTDYTILGQPFEIQMSLSTGKFRHRPLMGTEPWKEGRPDV